MSPFNFLATNTASYRRKGQRGRAAEAVFRSDLSDPRGVLESLVGELVAFSCSELEPDPSPPVAKADARSARNDLREGGQAGACACL